ncbi:MAG TPA: transglycosylase SLT domain-containing protein [Burkholderiaceae bacterium]|nr:transglycosylase SLT domain-containing protein [Burkholderiaceae bacterium]
MIDTTPSPTSCRLFRLALGWAVALSVTACAHLEQPTVQDSTATPSITTDAASASATEPTINAGAAAGRKTTGVPEPVPPVLKTENSAPSMVIETPEPTANVTVSDLWARMRSGFRIDPLTGPLVEKHEQWYASRPDYVQRMTERAGRYLYFILEEVERRNMPSEVALLPFIESAFNPQALSTAKASGMWQFIPGTGRNFGLRQTMFHDERRDVLESTRAALDYLEKLHAMFGDWPLAFAAYNCGEGNVQRAIERNRRAGKPTDYMSLSLPDETRNYVPKLQAVENIVAQPERFGLALPKFENEQYFVAVTKKRDIDVHRAAAFAGMTVDEFLALNPSFNKPVIIGAMQPQILLPRDKVAQFQANVDFAQGPLSSYTVYKVTSREKLDAIATKFKTSADHLRELNGLPRNIVLRPGATLLVPRPDDMKQDISSDVVESAALLYDPEVRLRRTTVAARKGDTLVSLAKRHGVSVAQLREWNSGARDRPSTGQTFVVYRPAVVARASNNNVRRTAAKRPTTAVAAKSTGTKTASRGRSNTKTAVAHSDSNKRTRSTKTNIARQNSSTIKAASR